MVEYYGEKNASIVIVAMGSVVGTLREYIRKSGQPVGVLAVKCFRPFPKMEVVKALSHAKYVAVLDKSISLGSEGILAGDVKAVLLNKTKAYVRSFVSGLGGRDITIEMIGKIVREVKKNTTATKFI